MVLLIYFFKTFLFITIFQQILSIPRITEKGMIVIMWIWIDLINIFKLPLPDDVLTITTYVIPSKEINFTMGGVLA